jgi:c-di-GMP-binding flagellar brake protein YcgR
MGGYNLLIHEIPVGTHILIRVDREGQDKYVPSIVDEASNYMVSILAPMEGTRLVSLSRAEIIDVLVIGQNGINKWSCKLVNRDYKNAVPIVTLTSSANSISYNRRNSYRVSLLQDIDYECNKKTYKGTLLDMSFIGIGFNSDIRHSVGEYIKFPVDLDGEILDMKAQIIRQPIKTETEIYKHGAITLNKENKIIQRFITETQRKNIVFYGEQLKGDYYDFRKLIWLFFYRVFGVNIPWIDNKHAFICSELVETLLAMVGAIPSSEVGKHSPSSLYEYLIKIK